MTKPKTELLPPAIQAIVRLFTAAGYEVAQIFEDNGHRVLGDESEPADRTDRGLSELCHEHGMIDTVRIHLRVQRTFETAEIVYDDRDLEAIALTSPRQTAELPGHMPAASRRVAESMLASGFRADGHLKFVKGDSRPNNGGLRVTLGWC